MALTNDSATTQADTPVDIAVLANDTVANSDLKIISITQPPPAEGVVVISADQRSVMFTPATGFVGTSQFTYQVGLASDIANVSVSVTAPPPPQQWTKVGQTSYGVAAGSSGTEIKNLPAGLQQNDIVLIVGASDGQLTAAGPSTTGYALIYDTGDAFPGGRADWKRMGATPDTTVSIRRRATNPQTGVIQVWRGADMATAIDVAATSVKGSTGMPNAPSYTPVTANALVFACGFLDDDEVAASVTAPAGYTEVFAANTSAGTGSGATVMMASKVLATPAAEDPSAFGGSGDDQWAACTFALRPVAGGGGGNGGGGGGGTADLPWVGVNTQTGYYTSASYVNAARDHCLTLGLGFFRNGIDGVGGRTDGASFNWTTRDFVVDTFAAAGIVSHGIIGPQFHVDKGGSITNWLNNWRYFCRNVFAHYYNRTNRVLHYSIDNEPDLHVNADPDYTPQFMVDTTRIAWEEAKAVSPDIMIEGPPCSNPDTQYQLDMLNLGLTRYCDFHGIHSYGDQMTDVYSSNIRLERAWLHQISANASGGWPIRPIIDKERGTSTAWTPTGLNGREYQKRSFLQTGMQHKRWGISAVCFFSFEATGGEQWDIVSSQVTGQDLNVVQQPVYDAIKNNFKRRGLENGGFEQANNIETDWVIAYAVEQTNPFEWTKISFPTTDPVNARSGNGYCRMDLSGNAPAINGGTVKTPVYNTRIVRRVVENLTPGQQYTITAYAKITGGGTATLKALGYNRVRGDEQQEHSTTVTGSYQQLQVHFTPSNPWVVISLEGSGTGSGRLIFWDDVSLA